MGGVTAVLKLEQIGASPTPPKTIASSKAGSKRVSGRFSGRHPGGLAAHLRNVGCGLELHSRLPTLSVETDL